MSSLGCPGVRGRMMAALGQKCQLFTVFVAAEVKKNLSLFPRAVAAWFLFYHKEKKVVEREIVSFKEETVQRLPAFSNQAALVKGTCSLSSQCPFLWRDGKWI